MIVCRVFKFKNLFWIQSLVIGLMGGLMVAVGWVWIDLKMTILFE